MEDMEQKELLQECEINFAKSFKGRKNGRAMKTLQSIGITGKSQRLATSFVHIVPNEDEFGKDMEAYLRRLLSKLVDKLNERAASRAIKYENVLFKVPKSKIVNNMTTDSLISYFPEEDCLDLFSFVYDKRDEDYADTDKLLSDYPHITKEFLGTDTANNRLLLKRSH